MIIPSRRGQILIFLYSFFFLSLSLYKRYTGYFLLDVKNPGPAVYILNTTHSAHRHPLEGSGGAECRRRRPSVSPRTKWVRLRAQGKRGEKEKKSESLRSVSAGWNFPVSSGRPNILSTHKRAESIIRRTARALTHTHTHNDRLKRKGGKIKSKES